MIRRTGNQILRMRSESGVLWKCRGKISKPFSVEGKRMPTVKKTSCEHVAGVQYVVREVFKQGS